jgi:hypothetical protein
LKKQQKITEYTLVLHEVNLQEQKLNDCFLDMIRRQKVEQFRCRDYARRTFNLDIIYDHININFFTEENIKKVKNLIVEYEKLRKKQKNLEHEINQSKVVENQLERQF